MIRRVVLASAICVVFLTAAVACAKNSDRAPVSTITAPIKEKFSSRAAAVAAAREAYREYLAASSQVGSSGGEELDRLAPFVTDAELEAERHGADYLRTHNLRIVGSSELLAFEPQVADLRAGAITAYACVNVAGARVLDTAGKDVTPTSRKERQTSIARFVWADGGLKLSETAPWSGESIC
ncbi:hypothetical protein [Amnibacterium kyonggiense]